VAWLQAQGARTIGLETMPRTTENIGFYSQLGFVPSHLTITLQHEHLTTEGERSVRLSTLGAEAQQQAIRGCRDAANRVAPGIDFTREIELTLELRLGDVTLHQNGDGTVHTFALWHTASLAQGRNRDEVRILKLVAPDVTQALDVVRAVEREGAFANLGRIALRCQTRQGDLYARLVEDGYRVHWTDLRMTLAGYPEIEPQGVLLSNWEI
jgi:hypothetical protein